MNVNRRTKALRRSKMKRFKKVNWIAASVAILVTASAWLAWLYLGSRTNQAHTERKLETEIRLKEEKQVELQKLDLTKQQLDEQNKKLEQEKQELQKLLEAKRASQTAYAATAPIATPVKPSYNCDDPKSCIYAKESGNNPGAVNSIGCRGLGQACPGTKLPCGDDYACQDAWFTDYAMNRYGSWEAAWEFWQNNHWW